MFEALSGKVIAGIMSLSMFLFSSYTGNDPSFRSLRGFVNNNYLQLNTTLDYAFDNDFADVFKSGNRITMFYRVEIRSGSNQVFQKTYQNSVIYDAMKNSYRISHGGLGQSTDTASHANVVSTLSLVSCSIPVDRKWGNVSVSIEAWLPTIEFAQVKRKVDLMVLWKFRKPSTKAVINTRSST